MEEDDFMDATLQVHAFGLSAGEDLALFRVLAVTGCTLCLDNVPNQLAVLGHFRAMLEMCAVAAKQRVMWLGPGVEARTRSRAIRNSWTASPVSCSVDPKGVGAPLCRAGQRQRGGGSVAHGEVDDQSCSGAS